MIKLITHNDLDGVGCYIVAKIMLEEEVDVTYCNYGDVNEEVLKAIEDENVYSKIFITDISVTEEVANELDKIWDKVVLLDHHPTALFLNKYSWAKVEEYLDDEEKTCGTKLLYDYLGGSDNKVLEEFVEKTRLFDTWLWFEKYNDATAKKLNDLRYILGKEDFANDILSKVEGNSVLFTDFDIKLLDLRQREIDSYVESKDKSLIVKNIKGYTAGVVFADNFMSELGNRLSELHPELDLIAMINQKSVSYRTVKDNVNLTELAQYFGGGGHPKASGSSVSEDAINGFINDLFGN